MRSRHILAIFAVLVVSSLPMGCGGRVGVDEPVAAVRPAARSGEFVGSAVCAECHAQVADAYAQHPMGRSIVRVEGRSETNASDAGARDLRGTRGPTVLEDYEHDVEFAAGRARRYRVERRDDGVWHHEIGLDASGGVRYDQSVPVTFAIGSGKRGRSYVIDRDGWLFMSPISWYARTSQWDLSPEYDPELHPRFERPASDRCLQCHAGRLHRAERATTELAQRYAQPPFEELSIGCERCHGPGGAHVARHRAAFPLGKGEVRTVPTAEEADETIVNPARLDGARADAVCNQCHLLGSAQFLRYGRTHDDFRPGDRLSDIWATFVSGTGVARDRSTRAVSHVEQMHASRCFESSGGRMGCATCHDAHGVPAESERTAFFDGRCARCHDGDACAAPTERRSAAPANGSCIACHMPRLVANDVPHTTQTDHRIPRSPEAANVDRADDRAANRATKPAEDSDSLDAWTLFEDSVNQLPAWERDRARGLLLAQAAEQSKDVATARRAIPLLRATVVRAQDDVDSRDALAICLLLDGQADAAVQQWEHALAIEPNRQSPLYSLALYWRDRGQPTKANLFLERLIAVNPWQAELHGHHSTLLVRLGRLDDAVKAAERAWELNPSLPHSAKWLAELYQRQGRTEDAKRVTGEDNPRNGI